MKIRIEKTASSLLIRDENTLSHYYDLYHFFSSNYKKLGIMTNLNFEYLSPHKGDRSFKVTSTSNTEIIFENETEFIKYNYSNDMESFDMDSFIKSLKCDIERLRNFAKYIEYQTSIEI